MFGTLSGVPWPLGAVVGRHWGLLGHCGNHLAAHLAIFKHLRGHEGLTQARLEPSRASLDVLTGRCMRLFANRGNV